MTDTLKTRKSSQHDVRQIEELYPSAFPDEDLLALLSELLSEEPPVLSLVAEFDDELTGHVIFSPCTLSGSSAKVALLGPLAVAPVWQRKGVGSALVQAGFRILKDTGTVQVHVLGDPAYYMRFGFTADKDVTPPYTLPDEWHGAWQSLSLDGKKPVIGGQLSVPLPWRHKALWVE